MLSLQFEFERIKNNKKIAIIAILLLILSITVVYMGIYEYRTFLKEKEIFLEYERLRINNIDNYQYYGALGFKVLFERYPLDILFNISSFRNRQTVNIDVSEIIDIGNSSRGKSRFSKNNIYIKGFCDIICLFGSLFMVFLGTTSFSGINNRKLYKSIKPFILSVITRLLVSSLYFFGLFVLAYIMVMAFGINFSAAELKAYVHYSVYILVLLIGFFIFGFMIALLNANSKNQNMKFVYAFLFSGLMIVGIPIISSIYISFMSNNIKPIEILNINKLRSLRKFEDESKRKFFELMKKKDADRYEIAREIMKDYINRIFPANNSRENDFINKEKRMSHLEEICSMIFPTIYNQFLSKELSSDGNYEYLQFLNNALKVREDFIRFYIHKRYYAKDKKIENFVKADENIFKAQPIVPPSYFKALGILFLWELVIALVCCLKLWQIFIKRIKAERPGWHLEKGNFYFKYIPAHKKRSRIFSAFEADGQVSCLEKIEFEDIEPKANINTLLTYWCQVRRVPEKQVKRHLTLLGIEDVWERDNHRMRIDALFLKKLYLALVLAEPGNLLVIHDFIKNEDREFDRQFRELLHMKIAQGKTVLYLTSIMPETERRKTYPKTADNKKPVKIADPNVISFR